MGIYLDNAATTMQKPASVIEAVAAAMGHMGNSGRGAYGEALDASRIIYGTRERISELVGLGNPKQVAFTSNSTEALNTAILGLFGPGDHVISTVMEHNSVLRPLYRLEKAGMGVSFCPCDEKGRLRTELLSGLVKENTKAKLLLLEPFLLHADPAKECFREDLDPKILAARRVARDYADMFLPLDGLLAAASVIEEPSHWSGDGVHPNEAGSRLIGRYYAEAFAAMLGK